MTSTTLDIGPHSPDLAIRGEAKCNPGDHDCCRTTLIVAGLFRRGERGRGMGLTLLVDAPSLVYRALFSTPDTVRTPAGEPINAAYGFLGMLARLVAGQHPDELACADDAAWRPEWRGPAGRA